MPKPDLNTAKVQPFQPRRAVQQTAAFRDLGTIVARQVKLAYIAPNPFQPRQNFDEEAMAELTDDIREHGVLQPIIVRTIPGADDDDMSVNPDGSPRVRYQIIAGERRYRAAQAAGLPEIPAIIREDIDDKTARYLSLIENVQRQDIDPLDEAAYFLDLQNQYNLSNKEIAKAINKSEPYVSRRLSDYQAYLRSKATQSVKEEDQRAKPEAGKDSEKRHNSLREQELRFFSQTYMRPLAQFNQYLQKANQNLADLEKTQRDRLWSEIEGLEQELAAFKRALEGRSSPKE